MQPLSANETTAMPASAVGFLRAQRTLADRELWQVSLAVNVRDRFIKAV